MSTRQFSDFHRPPPDKSRRDVRNPPGKVPVLLWDRRSWLVPRSFHGPPDLSGLFLTDSHVCCRRCHVAAKISPRAEFSGGFLGVTGGFSAAVRWGVAAAGEGPGDAPGRGHMFAAAWTCLSGPCGDVASFFFLSGLWRNFEGRGHSSG